MNAIYRYTVLAHVFNNEADSFEFLIHIAERGECAVLPHIRGWKGGRVIEEYEIEKTEKGWRCVQVLPKEGDYEEFKADIEANKLLKLEEDDEREDGEKVFFKHRNGRFYTVGHSAYQVSLAMGIELVTGKDGLVFLSFSDKEYREVFKKLTAEGWVVCNVDDYKVQ